MPETSYTTADLNVAAFLLARGHRLTGLDGPRQRRQFVFVSGAEDAPKYFLGEPIPARDFAAALKSLKAALYGFAG